jgi:hypothetical protein
MIRHLYLIPLQANRCSSLSCSIHHRRVTEFIAQSKPSPNRLVSALRRNSAHHHGSQVSLSESWKFKQQFRRRTRDATVNAFTSFLKTWDNLFNLLSGYDCICQCFYSPLVGFRTCILLGTSINFYTYFSLHISTYQYILDLFYVP